MKVRKKERGRKIQAKKKKSDKARNLKIENGKSEQKKLQSNQRFEDVEKKEWILIKLTMLKERKWRWKKHIKKKDSA